jgi:hypothetical protein
VFVLPVQFCVIARRFRIARVGHFKMTSKTIKDTPSLELHDVNAAESYLSARISHNI